MAVVVIDTIKPKNQGTFPVVEAADVKVTDSKRLDAALNDKADQSDVTALQTAVAGKASQADLTALSETVSGKQNALTEAQLTAVNSGITSELVTQIGTNTTAIEGKASASDVATETASLQAQIDAIVTPVTEDAEVENARIDSNGITHTSLKARIDNTEAVEKNRSKLYESISYSRYYATAVTLPLNGFEYVARGTINSSGEIVNNPSSSSAVFKIGVNGLKSFDIVSATTPSSSVTCCAFYTSAGVYVANSSKILSKTSSTTNITVPTDVPDNGYMLIVWFSYFTDSDAYYEALSNVLYKGTNDVLAAKENIDNAQINKSYLSKNLSDMTFYHVGYVKADGSLQTSSSSNAIYTQTVGKIRAIAFTSATAFNAAAFGAVYSSGGTLKQVFNSDNTTNRQVFVLENSAPTDVIFISWFAYQSNPTSYYNSAELQYEYITTVYEPEIVEIIRKEAAKEYYHCVKKSMTFADKKLQFFGDSITWGYITGGTRATNNYPKVFSQDVNAASYTNSAVSGSTLAVVSEHDSIYTKIQSDLDTTADIVFVAGGINDWQLGVTASDLSTAVDNICNYLSENFTGEVIFITPINESGFTPRETPTQTITSVRRIITETALTYGYSVVQGWQFPFPDVNGDSSYKATMFQDNVHPTEIGYAMYAKALESAVL